MTGISHISTPGLSKFFVEERSEAYGGAGFAVLRPGMEEEFQKFATEKLREAQKADIAASKKESGKHVQLKKDQLEYLASTYNPRKMSKAEYSAFIHDMVDMGVITEDDTRFLKDVDGYVAYVSIFEPGGSCELRMLDTAAAPYFYFGCDVPNSYADSKGDILTWYGFESSYLTSGISGVHYRSRTERTYGKVYDVLKQMAQMRPDSAEAVQEKQKSVQRKYQASRLAWDLKYR